MMQIGAGLQPALASRLALTPHLRGQIELVALDAQQLESHLAKLLTGRDDILLLPSTAQTLARLYPHRAAAPREQFRSGDGLAAERAVAAGPDLIAHVSAQLGLLLRDASDRQLAEEIILHLAPTGWLDIDPVAEALSQTGGDPDRVGRVLDRLQQIEPAGLFARNLRECLWLQARDHDLLDSIMETLLDNLSLLADGKIDEIAPLAKTDPSEIKARLRHIKSFDPKPGLRFGTEMPPPPEPDLILRKVLTGWTAEVNPRLRCEIRVLRPGAEGEANGLNRLIAFRETTLLLAGQWFASSQIEFLTHGPGSLKPVTRRRLAAEFGLHETTIGRALRDRLMQTPRGMFVIDRLFGAVRPRRQASQQRSSQLCDAEGAAAPEAVRARLASLIRAEVKSAPLTDESLAAELAREGLNISRRTVAKYRMALGIPVAANRLA